MRVSLSLVVVGVLMTTNVALAETATMVGEDNPDRWLNFPQRVDAVADNYYPNGSDTLIKLDGNDEEASMWTADEGWDKTDLPAGFSMSSVDTVYHLNSGELLFNLLYSFPLLFSEDDGFSVVQLSEDGTDFKNVATNGDDSVLFACAETGEYDEEGPIYETSVKMYSVDTDIASDAVALSENPVCFSQSEATFAGTYSLAGGVLLDWLSRAAYDMNDQFSVITDVDDNPLGVDSSIRGSSIFARKANGDQVRLQDEHNELVLDGYDKSSNNWSDIITIDDYSTVTAFVTRDDKHIVALVGSKNSKHYSLYRWSTTAGWTLENEYEFDQTTTVIVPSEINDPDDFYWAFWTNATDTMKAYRWNGSDGASVYVTRSLVCDSQCSFKLDVSKKGKLLLYWHDQPNLWASVWDKESWSTDQAMTGTFADDNDVAQFVSLSHVTPEANGLLFYSNDAGEKYVVRWKPDGGWQASQRVYADLALSYKNSIIVVNVNNTDQTVTAWQVKLHQITEIYSHDNVAELKAAFVFNDNLMLNYDNTDNVLKRKVISL